MSRSRLPRGIDWTGIHWPVTSGWLNTKCVYSALQTPRYFYGGEGKKGMERGGRGRPHQVSKQIADYITVHSTRILTGFQASLNANN